MTHFEPIDEKEFGEGADYRARVRGAVELRVGSRITDLESGKELIGKWYCEEFKSSCEWLADGTAKTTTRTNQVSIGKWAFKDGVAEMWSWCDPLPEYGMPEGTWEVQNYHCGKANDHRIVFWNGDGSLVWTIRPVDSK